MKVRELIRRLKQQNPEAEVCWQSHDQSEYECDGWVRFVSDASDALCEAEGVKLIVVLKP